MKVTIDLPDLMEYIKQSVENALKDKQTQLSGWDYYSILETCKLLQVKPKTLLDKRRPYLNELEYSRLGRIFWFTKKSVHDFIANRTFRKYRSAM